MDRISIQQPFHIQPNPYDEADLTNIIIQSRKPSFRIDHFLLQPLCLFFTLQSSLGFRDGAMLTKSGMKADAKETKGGFSDIMNFDNAKIELKEMKIENISGGYLKIFWECRDYLLDGLRKQM